LLACIFDWLQKWGISASIHEPEFEANLPDSKEGSAPDATSRNLDIGLKTEKVYGNHISGKAGTAIPMAVHMLGAFSMTIGDLIVKLPVSRGLSIFKYLLLHHKQSMPREVLMDIFWPDAEPEAARNNLNVALYNLRRALRTFTDLPVILFENGTYGLAPNLQVWLDLEEFERCVKTGQELEARDQLTASTTEYEAALSLYQGDFLEQTPYEEWTVLERERLRIAYLDTLDRLSQIYFNQKRYAACITICQLTLSHDPCREDAHRLLMRCYNRQRQHYLALRQYQICVEALRAELEVDPAPETRQLYEQIRSHEYVY
jgi:DNA-binding SARP family transcriptional activator